PTITSSRALIIPQLYGDGSEVLQPCGRKEHPALRQKSRNLLRRAPKGPCSARMCPRPSEREHGAAALVRSGLICYIERRRGARPAFICGRGGIGRRTSLRC